MAGLSGRRDHHHHLVTWHENQLLDVAGHLVHAGQDLEIGHLATALLVTVLLATALAGPDHPLQEISYGLNFLTELETELAQKCLLLGLKLQETDDLFLWVDHGWLVTVDFCSRFNFYII